MAIDIGDAVPDLVFLVYDAAGNPVDSTSGAVLTVTLPDGSMTTPSVTHVSTGVYAALAYTATQSGRHTCRWVSTNPARVGTDSFDVLGADPGFIISLDQARLAIGSPAGVVSPYDEDLRDLIAAATAPMEDLCGALLAATHDEYRDGGGLSICLANAPVISVTTVLETAGSGWQKTLTAQPVDGSAWDAFGYSLDDTEAGMITRRATGVAVPFQRGTGNIHVTYVAGRAVMPPNIIRATRRLVRAMFQQESNFNNSRTPGSAEMAVTPSGHVVPAEVVGMVAGLRRTQAIG